jgi:hypothetical protein
MNHLRVANPIVCAAAIVTSMTIVAVAPASAQATGPATSAHLGTRAFVTTLLQQSRGQLALARLAHQRAVGPITLSAATANAQEWSLLRARLIPIAYAEGAPVRGTLTRAQRAELDRLGRTPSTQFDRAYLADSRRADMLAIDRIDAEEGSADRRVLSFAAYAQPLIESYEQMSADDEKDHPGA